MYLLLCQRAFFFLKTLYESLKEMLIRRTDVTAHLMALTHQLCRHAPCRQETRMGYRECSISGCPCAAFKDTYGSDLCNNCGHKFTDHW
jgi:hypothetical protein